MSAVLERQNKDAAEAARSIDPDVVLSTPAEDLVDRLYEKFNLKPIVLHREQRTTPGAKDVPIYVDNWRGNRVKIDGTRIEINVPFDGEAALFDVRPSTYSLNPPRFEVRGRQVIVAHEGRAPLDPAQAKAAIENVLQDIEKHVSRQRSDIDPWNEQLKGSLRQLIEARRTKVLQDRELDAFLEVPIIGRESPAPSFVVDPPRKARPTVTETAGAVGFSPEPAVSDDGFLAVLSEIESVTAAVRRLPQTFADMPEESLRDVLLVVLNNRFGPATGETFSRRGKTDVFIPWGGDHRAVFLAECKWWKGPAAFRKAIDQLLGYLAWRDMRAALIVFSKEKSPSVVAEKATAELQRHPSFKRMQLLAGRSIFVLADPNDDRRETHVALLVIPVSG